MAYPLGVSFGPTYITAAHALQDGLIVPVTKAKFSMACHEFFKQNLEMEVQFDLDILSEGNNTGRSYSITNQQNLFVEALEAIKIEARHALGREIEIHAIITPPHWDGGAHTLKTFPTALCQGCDMPLDGLLGYAVLIVDYNTEYLHFALCDVSLGVALIEAEVHFPDLGEKAAPEPLSSQKDTIDLPFYHKCAAEHNEIILSGEAERTMGMMQALTEDFSEARGEIKLVKNGDIDLFYAGAIGAAPAAKKQVDGPKKTRDFISMPDCTAEEWDKLW